MRPKVFLSHSKTDKAFIERVANDLRNSRVDVWYDEWEIPPGESFRRRMVNGIEESDLFFVYLTPTSSASHWVQHELDSALVKQDGGKHAALAVFVDTESTRALLPLDLRALHAPVFNPDTYFRPFCQLLSRAWESRLLASIADAKSAGRMRELELENEVKTLQLAISRANAATVADTSKILAELDSLSFQISDQSVTLRKVFGLLSNELATSASIGRLQHVLLDKLGIEHPTTSLSLFTEYSTHRFSDILGPLIVRELVHLDPAHGDITDDYFFLTELGRKIAIQLWENHPPQ